MTKLLAEVAETMPPLRGVIHAAAVLDDGVLTQQTWERFERVLAPKAGGSLVLHELTVSLPLDFFVMFSSIASLAGAPGQANYAAGNAFEDCLAHERRRCGLPAISINWGAWKEGSAKREGLEQRHRQKGITAMSAEEGLALLDYILLDAPVQVAAGLFDWDRFTQGYPSGKVPKRFSELLRPAEFANRNASEPGLLERLADAPESARRGILSEYVRTVGARVLGIPAERRIDSQRALNELGLDSLMAVEFRNVLAAAVGQTLPSTLLFSYPTIDDVTDYLAELVPGAASGHPAPAAPDIGSLDVLENIEGLDGRRSRPAAGDPKWEGAVSDFSGASGQAFAQAARTPRSGVAVPARRIRAAELGTNRHRRNRLPDSFWMTPGPDGFWRLLAAGDDAVTHVPGDRWDVARYYDADADAPGRMSTNWGSFLSEVDRFDAPFFGISRREAVSMDPQQRILLEVCWEALENAGHFPRGSPEPPRGVFVGICTTDYHGMLVNRGEESIDAYLATGTAHSIAAGRISYCLGFQGPNLAVDTACSASLVAVHLACKSLRTRECRQALAGGVNAILSPEVTIALSKAHMMAGDGRCKAFDAAADGFVRGEGCGVVVLKRLLRCSSRWRPYPRAHPRLRY